jgi:hypothetical protein
MINSNRTGFYFAPLVGGAALFAPAPAMTMEPA